MKKVDIKDIRKLVGMLSEQLGTIENPKNIPIRWDDMLFELGYWVIRLSGKPWSAKSRQQLIESLKGVEK